MARTCIRNPEQCREVNSRYMYPVFEKPVGARKRHYPLVWYLYTKRRCKNNWLGSNLDNRQFSVLKQRENRGNGEENRGRAWDVPSPLSASPTPQPPAAVIWVATKAE